MCYGGQLCERSSGKRSNSEDATDERRNRPRKTSKDDPWDEAGSPSMQVVLLSAALVRFVACNLAFSLDIGLPIGGSG